MGVGNGASSAMSQSRLVYAAYHITSPALDIRVGHPLDPGSTRLLPPSSVLRTALLIIRTIPGIDTLTLPAPYYAKDLAEPRVSLKRNYGVVPYLS
jgi:hypothetical protein